MMIPNFRCCGRAGSVARSQLSVLARRRPKRYNPLNNTIA
jgi:hypothetical protein